MASYASKEQAIIAGKSLGIIGAHQMPNGKWMPGSSHATYLRAVKKRGGKPEYKTSKIVNSYLKK